MARTNRKLGSNSPRSITDLKREIAPLNTELGINSQLPFSTPFRPTTKTGSDIKDLEELMRDESQLGPSIRQLKSMRMSDGQARGLYQLLTLPLKASLKGCSFVPSDGGDKEAEFIRQVLMEPPYAGGMTITFSRFISQLLQALFDGFAPFEKVYWIPSDGPLKGKVTLKKIAYRPSETVTFIVDKEGSFRGFRQQTHTYGKVVDVYIPKSRAFYYAAQEEENPFYGVSFFQSAYSHWDKKVKLYFAAHLAAQRSAVGTRVGTVPRNASVQAKTEFARNMANMALNQYLIMPEGFELESVKEGGNYDFLSLINHHNSQMSKSILAQFFDKDQGAGRGESSVVDNESGGDDMFLLMLQSIMDDIAQQINHYIIPDLIDANFKGQKYPKFSWGKLTDDQKKRVSRTFDRLATAGEASNVTPEFMRELEVTMSEDLGFEIDYTEIEEREAEEREQMRQAVDAQNSQVESEVSLDSLEAETLPGDDEVTLTGDEGSLIRLAYEFLDSAVGELKDD